jgi:predicted metal-dependent hydrolase
MCSTISKSSSVTDLISVTFQLDLGFLGKRFQRPPAPRKKGAEKSGASSWVWKHGITVHLVTQPKARRYLLRFETDGTLRLVIPRRGNRAEGLRFLERSEPWILKRRARAQSDQAARGPWIAGSRFLFRGEEVALEVAGEADVVKLRFADQVVVRPRSLPDYREAIAAHLRQLAALELPKRTWELARHHGITIHRVTVRAQKTRWGSCSIRGAISLNWRLIQAPATVVDYLIIHELMHRREMNHSARYWKLVAEACPGYRDAETWLKRIKLQL